MRLIKEIMGLYGRNLIDMDEALHYYDLVRQHDLNLMYHNKVVPVWYVNNIMWKIFKMRDNKTPDNIIIDYVIKALQEYQTIGKFADNKIHPYKNWGTSTKMEDRYK